MIAFSSVEVTKSIPESFIRELVLLDGKVRAIPHIQVSRNHVAPLGGLIGENLSRLSLFIRVYILLVRRCQTGTALRLLRFLMAFALRYKFAQVAVKKQVLACSEVFAQT